MVNIIGSGVVLPPGSPVAVLPAGKITVTIESAVGENEGLFDAEGNPAVSEHLNARCVYPDGFVKNHQVKTPEDLVARVINQLRGRYGASEVKVIKLPESVSSGATIEMEI